MAKEVKSSKTDAMREQREREAERLAREEKAEKAAKPAPDRVRIEKPLPPGTKIRHGSKVFAGKGKAKVKKK